MHVTSFLRGAAFGAFLVYLFAPRSGVETRQMLAQRGNDLKKLISDDMMDFTGEVTDVAHTAVGSGNGNIYDPATLREVE